MDINIGYSRLVHYNGIASIDVEDLLRSGDADIDDGSAKLDGSYLTATVSVDILSVVREMVSDGDVDGDIDEEEEPQDVEIFGQA